MRWWIGVAILLILTFFLFSFRLFEPIGNALRFVSLPLVRTVSTWTQAGRDRVGAATATTDASARLRCEALLTKQVVDEAEFHRLEEENKRLRAQANFLSNSSYDHVGARVIGRELTQTSARLLIDRGTNDKLEDGQAVITENGLFIGRIRSPQTSVATVELLTDTNSRVSAAMVQGDQLIGVIEGRGNGASVLTYIPSSIDLEADQIVVTAGTEEKIPSHLALGIINALNRKPKDPFYEASVDPLVRFDRISFVSILRPSALGTR